MIPVNARGYHSRSFARFAFGCVAAILLVIRLQDKNKKKVERLADNINKNNIPYDVEYHTMMSGPEWQWVRARYIHTTGFIENWQNIFLNLIDLIHARLSFDDDDDAGLLFD